MGQLKQMPLVSRLAECALRAANPYTFFLALFTLVCFTAEYGPDYDRYLEWSSAVLSHDPDYLAGPALLRSPTGVPFRQWPAGPGLLIAPFRLIVAPIGVGKAAGLVTGMVCALVFWSCFFAGLRELSDAGLALLGCAVAFVATPLGYYSMTVSSETYSLLPAGILFLNTVALGGRKRASLLGIGVSTGILLMIRSYLAVYAWPALGVALFHECGEGAKRATRCLMILGVPIALAILQVGVVNYWMTGDPLQSPYQFGDEQFQSFDWRCPHLWNVLGDTFHGLLPTHPFMGMGFLLIIWLVATSLRYKRYREGTLWILAAVAVGINIYVQGCWYYWWLLYFGMRGLTLAAIPATAAFIRVQSLTSRGGPNAGRETFRIAYLGIAGGCVLWSWILLTQAQTTYYSQPNDYLEWGQMLRGQLAQLQLWLTPERIALLLFCAVPAAVMLKKTSGWTRPRATAILVMWLAVTLSTACLLDRLLFSPPPPLGLRYYGAVAAVAAAVVFGATFRPTIPIELLSTWVATFLLCGMLALFVPFAIHIQSGLDVQKDSTVVVDESHLIAAWRDLADVPRMASHRKRIADFLRRQKGEAWYERFQKSVLETGEMAPVTQTRPAEK